LAVFRLISSSNLADWDHRQFSRSRAVQNFAAVDAGLAIGVCQIRRIAHQAASSDELALAIDGRQCIACREPDDLVGPDPKERAGADHHCTGARLLRLVESSVDLSFSICMQNVNLLSDGARSLLHVAQLGLECRPARM